MSPNREFWENQNPVVDLFLGLRLNYVMQKAFPLALLLASATVSPSQAAIVWMCGLDDNGWPVGAGGGPNASFVQENASVNLLPGSPV